MPGQPYPTYLQRLRGKPVDELLLQTGGSQYPHALAAAVLLALDAARADDGTGLCGEVMDLVAVLSAAGVPQALVYAAGQIGVLSSPQQTGEIAAETVDEALGRTARNRHRPTGATARSGEGTPVSPIVTGAHGSQDHSQLIPDLAQALKLLVTRRSTTPPARAGFWLTVSS